jgi:hypothetical protein
MPLGVKNQITPSAPTSVGTGERDPALPNSRQFLSSENDIHRAWLQTWRFLDAGMKGGVHVLNYLRRFEWEVEDGPAINARKQWATYMNFPDIFLSGIAGLINKKLPKPDQGLSFGTLGKVSTQREAGNYQPTRADLIYYNADGIGNDGAEWDAWWTKRLKRAVGLGHVWIMEEAARWKMDRQKYFSDEIAGARPYLVEFGPDRVWDWHFEDGALQYAIIRLTARRPRVVADRFIGDNETNYLLFTRRGWDAFGGEYQGGGFWRYDSLGNEIVKGNWDKLDGEIPFHIFYGERDDEGGTTDMPSISRPAINELVSLAIGYMNLSSAADFEAWDSAKGIEYIIGAHQDAFNLAMDKINKGSRFIPVPVMEGAVDPRVQSSNMGTTPAQIFDSRFTAKREEAHGTGMQESASTPEASGVSKAAGFSEIKAPRLASYASEMQTTLNTSIPNLERRWGFRNPQGFTRIPRDFDLLEVTDAISAAFTVATENQIESATFKSKSFRKLLETEQVFTDTTELDTIEKEVFDSMNNRNQFNELTQGE